MIIFLCLSSFIIILLAYKMTLFPSINMLTSAHT